MCLTRVKEIVSMKREGLNLRYTSDTRSLEAKDQLLEAASKVMHFNASLTIFIRIKA